jgi:hypothetical protein
LSSLIYRDHFIIGQQGKPITIHMSQIISGIQGRRFNGPQRHIGLSLIVGDAIHTAIGDLQGIQIIPATRAGILRPPRRIIKTPGETVPGDLMATVTLDITINAPGVSILLPEAGIVDIQRV